MLRSLYLETSVISYYTARLSRDLVVAAIRSFGLLANRGRDEQLARCRQLLDYKERETVTETSELLRDSSMDEDTRRCPACGQGTLLLVARTPRPRQSELVASTYQLRIFDSS